MRLFLALLVVLAGLSTASAQLSRGYEPTRINIVLVAFNDDAGMPHGFTRPGGVLTPGGNSYTLEDFARKFGASGSFEGLVDVANDHETVTSYGSLREYYKEVSEGSLNFDVRIVNQDLGGDHAGYPEWIVLGDSRQHYREANGEFFPDALEEMHDYIRMNYETETLDWSGLPATINAPTDELIVFIYAGWQVDDRVIPMIFTLKLKNSILVMLQESVRETAMALTTPQPLRLQIPQRSSQGSEFMPMRWVISLVLDTQPHFGLLRTPTPIRVRQAGWEMFLCGGVAASRLGVQCIMAGMALRQKGERVLAALRVSTMLMGPVPACSTRSI